MSHGAVYFLQAGGPGGRVKIGWTRREVRRRVRELQVGSSEPLSLLAESPGSQDDEAALHARFAPCRVQGEWFAPTEGLLELVLYLADGGTLAAWLT